MESPPEGETAPRADFVSALLWVVFGGAIAIGSWRMDRLEHLHINKYEAPGLVPGILGTAIVVLGLVLAVRAVRGGALQASPRVAVAGGGFMALVFAFTLGYALLLVGHGIPFWLATLLFVSLFVYVFDGPRQAALGRPVPRRALFALVCGGVTSAVVSLAFEQIFYVRLP